MRLWTLHPKYLDRQGLVAVWREGLLAQAVLSGKTKSYKNHPQLSRFKTHPEPLRAIAYYLHEVSEEAKMRDYKFDVSKIDSKGDTLAIQTTSDQLDFEKTHLLGKLKQRSREDYDVLINLENLDPHPLFQIIPGGVEDWEKGNRKY